MFTQPLELKIFLEEKKCLKIAEKNEVFKTEFLRTSKELALRRKAAGKQDRCSSENHRR